MNLTLLDGTPCYFLGYVDNLVSVSYVVNGITVISSFPHNEILVTE